MAGSKPDPRDRILDVAERVFASEGIEAVSMRSLAAQVGITLSNLQYHFPSKPQLLEACFARCIAPINAARCVRLDVLLSGDGPVDVEQVVDAWVRPLVDTHHPDRAVVVMRFIGRFLAAAVGPEYARETYDEVGRRAINALQKALPEDDITDIVWKYNFMIGVLLFTLGGQMLMARLPPEFDYIPRSYDPRSADAETTLKRLVKFVGEGMRAPLPPLAGSLGRKKASKAPRS
jgi:AcrR family transcriptional regulator